MHLPDFDHVAAEAVTRIWAQVTANAANVSDLFERMTESLYTKVVQPGDTVVDGGAHSGRHALPLARLVGNEGVVMAFEPLPMAADRLHHSVSAAALDRRVRLRREALSREPGKRPFYVVHNMPEFSGLTNRDYADFLPEQSEIQVQVTTIDAAVGGAGRWPAKLSFIKLDLEGGEFRAFQGAEQTLRRYQPCCVFENGLHSSADDYDAHEFFGFFQRLDYHLYDILGCRVDERHWMESGPWQFVAIPGSRAGGLLPCLWTSALEELLMTPWTPAGQTGLPPSTFGARPEDGADVIGCVDQSDMSVRIRGWAGNLRTGRGSSIVVTIDGKPVAAAPTGKPRHDVVGATGIGGFADCGFDVVLPLPPMVNVEVYAESSSGTFKKIGRS